MASSKTNVLKWKHVGPTAPPAIAVPPMAPQITEYVLALDESRGQLVYARSPDYHQFGHAWAWDGKKWERIASTAYRLGDAGHWQGGYDPVHGALVGWTFDSEHPVGVVVGKKSTVIAEAEAFTTFSDDPFTRFEVSGEAPRPAPDSEWDDITGVFGIDRERRVTVCLTPAAVYELSGKTWKKVLDVPKKLLPASVDGSCARGVYDPARKAIVFALLDSDAELHLFTWDGATLARLVAKGLPKKLSAFFDKPVIGSHDGLVVLARGSLFSLGAKGFTEKKVETPAKLSAGVLGADQHGRVVLGPHKASHTDQQAFVFFGDETERHGGVAKKSPLADLTNPRVVHTGSSVLAVDTYLRTHEWTAAKGWEERVSGEKGDELRDEGTVQALVIAWGAPHVIFADGRVFSWQKGWKPVLATKPKDWAGRIAPAVAFDQAQKIIVLFGGSVKNKVTTDTLIFDGKTWLEGEGPKPKDDKKEAAFALAWDAAAKAVVRIGLTEIAHFRSKWEPAARKDLKSFRGFFPPHDLVLSANGRVLCVQPGEGIITELGTKARRLGRFKLPQPRTQQSHSDHFIDHAVIDEKNRLLAFLDDDVFASFALELP